MARPKIIKDPTRITLYVPRTTRKLLAVLAADWGTSLSGAVTRLIKARLETRES